MKSLAPAVLALFIALPAHAGLEAHFQDTVEAEIGAFRGAIAENALDDDAYYTLVIGLELKGALDGDWKHFAELKKSILKPGETLAHHRLAAALRHRGHEAEALYVDNDADSGVTYVVNQTTS